MALALVASAATPTLAQEEDLVRLEALCTENTANEQELSTCLEVVRTFLAPPAEDADTVEPARTDGATVSGKGETATEAIELAGGDYLVTFSVSAPKKGRDSCLADGSLKNTEDNYGVVEFFADTPKGKPREIQTYAYDLEPGRYYAEVWNASCPRWEVAVEPVEIDYGEPTQGSIIRTGKSGQNTEAFSLAGGDYLIAYQLDAAKSPCELSASLLEVGDSWGDVVDIEGAAEKRKSDTGETRAYSVEPGQYYWNVQSSADWYDGAKCVWTLEITPS